MEIFIKTYSHEFSATSLSGITLFANKATQLLENWSFNTVLKISSLGDLPVFLSFANGSALRKTTLEVFLQASLFFNSLKLFLNFQGFISSQGVDVVDSLAVTVQALFTNLEVRLSHRCFSTNLNLIGYNFTPEISNNKLILACSKYIIIVKGYVT